MTLVTDVTLGLLAVAALLCVVRLIRPGSLADRTIALDTLLVVIVCGIGTYAARSSSGMFLDALVVAALLGFTSTSLVARFIERRGA